MRDKIRNEDLSGRIKLRMGRMSYVTKEHNDTVKIVFPALPIKVKYSYSKYLYICHLLMCFTLFDFLKCFIKVQ